MHRVKGRTLSARPSRRTTSNSWVSGWSSHTNTPRSTIRRFRRPRSWVRSTRSSAGPHREHLVVPGLLAEGVEAEQAQVPGERGDVTVGHEADLARGTRPHRGLLVRCQRREVRVDAHAGARTEAVVEPDRLTVDQDELDLGVGHPERLDGVLRRPSALDGHAVLASCRYFGTSSFSSA